MSRTRKRPYTKSKSFDRTCRNHGACSWCRDGRLHRNLRRGGLRSTKRQGNPSRQDWR